VETAENGKAGLALLEKEEFDLVLLDMIMPGLGGTDVLKQMKNRRKLSDIPVIIISALDDQEGIAECIELGAEDYLSKPFRPAILHARINSSLEKRRLRQEENKYLKRLQEEQAKSDRLLLNILPAAVAERLKSAEDASIADHFESVTVLFADLVDFTTLAATERPERVVEILNQIFSSFDVMAERRGLEKIKTIGDAYMAVAGLPVPRADHAEAAALFAIDMLEEIEHFSLVYGVDISLRVGIDSGPVIAGIIGRNKFTYDLWGDTVNTASRMESLGLPGCVQVTASTRALLRDKFSFRERGEIDVKGKGRMLTWLLEA
jgi:class 3 adenylate cyclase